MSKLLASYHPGHLMVYWSNIYLIQTESNKHIAVELITPVMKHVMVNLIFKLNIISTECLISLTEFSNTLNLYGSVPRLIAS